MATEKPRFTITLDEDLYKEVLDYKETNAISTQSKAIQRLVRIAVADADKQALPGKLDELMNIADHLNEDDLRVLVKTAQALKDRQ